VVSRVEVRASAKEFSRYRKLVDSDWNKTTFDAVLELMWDVVKDSAWEQGEPIELTFLRHIHDKKRASVVPAEFIERLRALSMIFREPNVPLMPKEFALGTSRIAVQSGAAAVYLLLQVDMKITGEAGFFRDLQSLLYLNSVHYLLPQLQIDELQTGHDSLANALAIHAFLVWRDEPSHMFYLLAAMMGHLGHKRARLDFLHSALSATPIDDHSYLTKASAYWSELLELGEKDAAMDFLLRLNRNVPESYVPEIAEMITETAEFQAQREGESPHLKKGPVHR
jgi:hypothetical protein